MAILNPTTVTVDAILTTKGRELLARNDGSFQITQFALADDEIDYTLYNPTHPSGSAFYGEAIENTPVLEAFPNESQIMRFKLVTLPRGTSRLPVITLGQNQIPMPQGTSKSIRPETLNYQGTTTFEANGYVATIADSRLVSSFKGEGINPTTSTTSVPNLNTTTGTVVSSTQIGTSFTITATNIPTLFGTNNQLSTTITFIGRDSGARITVPLIITKSTN